MTYPLDLADFIKLSYGESGLLINRQEIVASLYNNIETVDTQGHGVTLYHERKIPVIPVTSYLEKYLSFPIQSESHFFLILDASHFHPEHQYLMGDFCKRFTTISEELPDSKEGIKYVSYVALEIKGVAQMENVSIRQLALLPAGLSILNIKHGILGIRFRSQGGIDYFVDLETIVSNIIQEKMHEGINR